ncbi:hypothetical protein OAP05_07540 [Schleiferiaceae bacterium]|nr:hypothetical protein [Schleiferiaceae bacterium]
MQYEYDKFDRISAIFAPRELNTAGSPAMDFLSTGINQSIKEVVCH